MDVIGPNARTCKSIIHEWYFEIEIPQPQQIGTPNPIPRYSNCDVGDPNDLRNWLLFILCRARAYFLTLTFAEKHHDGINAHNSYRPYITISEGLFARKLIIQYNSSWLAMQKSQLTKTTNTPLSQVQHQTPLRQFYLCFTCSPATATRRSSPQRPLLCNSTYKRSTSAVMALAESGYSSYSSTGSFRVPSPTGASLFHKR